MLASKNYIPKDLRQNQLADKMQGEKTNKKIHVKSNSTLWAIMRNNNKIAYVVILKKSNGKQSNSCCKCIIDHE